MSAAAEPARRGERIWVALDSASQSDRALEVAALLAHRERAELAGLFVEDVDLLRLAGLPLASEISPISAMLRPLGFAELERQLRSQAAGLERELARLARGAGLTWSFQVRRGKPLAEAMALPAADVMVIAGRRPAAPLPPAHGRVPRAARGAVIVLQDASPAAARTLALARELTVRLGATLEVVAAATEPAAGTRPAGPPREPPGRLARAAGAVLDAQARRADALLVLSARDPAAATRELLEDLLPALHCPLVLA
ncbi:MAG: hypothetical protein JNM90_02335 [Burkholderiales bacterium]|nr:hypothetical protein [Burkholderiales bacterium]